MDTAATMADGAIVKACHKVGVRTLNGRNEERGRVPTSGKILMPLALALAR